MELDGTLLVCYRCPKYENGEKIMVRASIPTSLCAVFGYRNGRLQCDKDAGFSKLPDGSYKNSCASCHVAKNILWCEFCKGHKSTAKDIKIDFRKCKGGDIKNLGGNLVCTGSEHAKRDSKEWIPGGSYRDSCLGCSVDGNRHRLTCTRCWSDTVGEFQLSWINIRYCHHFRNSDGRLECETPHEWDEHGNLMPPPSSKSIDGVGTDDSEVASNSMMDDCTDSGEEFQIYEPQQLRKPPKGMPAGSYLNTCHGCRLSDDKSILLCLSCAGKSDHGEASIEIRNCDYIYNEKGMLRCFQYGGSTFEEDDGNRDSRQAGSENAHFSIETRKRATKAPAKMISEGLPDGSYAKSCHGCRLSEDASKLICLACAGQTDHAQVSIELAGCDYVYSEHGLLKCFRYGNGPSKPANRAQHLSSYDGNHLAL